MRVIKNEIIAVDFDGTLCENKWPGIGKPNENLIEYLKYWQGHGAKIILWTCRSKEMLQEAVAWCHKQGLIFDAVNENLPEAIEEFGGDSRKIYADKYIDDKNDNYFSLPYKSGETERKLQEYLEAALSKGE